MTAFQPFPKIPRLFRDMVVTEKLDGTNAAVQVVDIETAYAEGNDMSAILGNGLRLGTDTIVKAQSRKRLITPGADNHGFAAWVWEHAAVLAASLGPGVHFGEWWGQGIGRKYGLDHKRFSLFNVKRWGEVDFTSFGLENVDTVPLLDTYTFSTPRVNTLLNFLREAGCQHRAALGFKPAEGVVVFHPQGGYLFKATIEGDDKGKDWGA